MSAQILPSERPVKSLSHGGVVRCMKAREDLDLTAGELGDPADGGEVAVLVLEDEQVHRDLLAGTVQRQLLIEVRAGVQ